MFGLFEGIKAGKNAVSKRTGNPVVVERVEYDKAFVRSVGNLSGEMTGSWCDKHAFRPPRDGEEYYCGWCGKMMPISHFPH